MVEITRAHPVDPADHPAVPEAAPTEAGLLLKTSVATAAADQVDTQETNTDEQDRRRPGRRKHVNPELIGLLRRNRNSGVSLLQDHDEAGALSPARGIVVASLISTVAWLLIGLAAWVVYQAAL